MTIKPEMCGPISKGELQVIDALQHKVDSALKKRYDNKKPRWIEVWEIEEYVMWNNEYRRVR
jgi:hypothetical protein